MEKQMELFEDGGLKDEGGMVDEESGNKVPAGGTRKGVRDDIPANISEGEFIFPEDVTRYIGLDKLMQLRQEAKMGLKRMEAMGQMGNSDEATIDDDLPFSMADLIIIDGGLESNEEMNMAEGGLTTSTTGSRRTLPQTTTPTVPTTPPTNTVGAATRRLTPVPITRTSIPIDFKKLMGEASIEYKEYRNAEGKSVIIPHIGGVAQFPVPDGYTLYVGADSVEGSDTTAGAIVSTTNAATTEARIASGDSDNDSQPSTPAPDPINWSELSTDELIAESSKLTGVGSTIAKGAMAFMGPFSVIGSLLMRHQEKKVAQEIANRIAAGGLTAAQLKTLTETQEKLTPKGFTLIGKIIDFVGGALGADAATVETAKKNTAKIETSLEVPPQDSAAAVATSIRPVARPTTTGDTPMRTQMDVIADATEIASTLDFMEDEETVMQQTVVPSGEDIIMQQPVVSREELYASDANQQPDFGATVPTVPTAITSPSPFADAFGDYTGNAQLTKVTDNLREAQAELANRQIADQATAQTTPAVDPSGGNYAVTPQQVAYSTSVSQSNEDRYDPRGILPTSEQLVTQKFPVAPSPVTGLALQPEATRATGELAATEAARSAYQDQIDAQREAQAAPEVPGGTLPRSVQAQQPVVKAPATVDTSVYTQPDTVLPKIGVPTSRLDTKGITPTATQTQQVFSTTPTPVDTSNIAGISAASAPDAFDPRNLGGSEGYGTPQTSTEVAPAPAATTTTSTETFSDAFARNRAAGADTFTYDGKSYTTQTAEEAATQATPTGTNSLFQSAANLFTPSDGKEYVGGVLVDTKTGKQITKAETPKVEKSTSTGATLAKTTSSGSTIIPTGTTIATGTKLNSKSDPVVIVDNKAYNKSKAPTTKTTSSSKSTTTSSTKSVQAQINEKIKNATDSNGNVDWNKADVGALVKQRDAAKSSSSSSSSSGGNSGGYSCYVATALNDAGYWSTSKKLKLIKWCIEAKPENKLDTKLWRNGYVVFGKNVIAPKINNKIIQWLSNGFYCATVQKETNLQAILGKLFFYVPSYSIGLWKALRGNLVDIERT